MSAAARSIADRIREGVEITSSRCWLWTKGQNGNGYGRLRVDGRMQYVHRLAYEAFVGPIPIGLVLDHVNERGCTSPACCNPAHLEPVTNGENGRRGIKGVLTTHCPSGHAYTPENIRIRPNGHRVCRTCHRDREAQRRLRKAV